MSKRIANSETTAGTRPDGKHCLSGSSLITLAQSEMGLGTDCERLEEVMASMQAHVAARGFPEDWSKVEVPRLLHGWVCCYASADLGAMLELWVDLLLWLRQLSLVPESIAALYLRDTRAWLTEQRRLSLVYDRLWRRLGLG